MKIGVVLITYAIDVTPLIKSMDGPDVSWRIFTHSANQEVIAALNFIPVRSDMRPDIKLYDYRQNRGLAKSWNEGLIDAYAMGADAVIIANDDIVATYDDLMVLANAAQQNRDYGVVVCEGQNLRMNEHQNLQFAILAINPLALETIWYFDESFTPIYFED